ncbi:M56 family metallopeptidase [Geosporobacter ferrireducens]|uniref:M56 family metallopeptidase n=1 Tax=Geosporobacter ferrireducens TaxID=1424294 RepID=UPI0023573781|nr:M56 family metallopeptidase [Geosporobacter ferrireducens]
MGELFLSVLNMSLTASYVILFVILVRLLLSKAPKVISYALWVVVAFRLIIPFSFESMFSLLPRSANIVPIPHDIIYQQIPQINSGIEVVDSFVSKSLPAPTIGASVNPLQIYTEIGAYIWILGIMVLLIYSVVSVLQLKRQLKSAQLIEQNIFEAKNLKTPFVLGLIRPKIYLPLGLNVEERGYILLHEQTHIHRKDHITKVLAFLILSIHWFNPLVWIAFMLMSTDMELSCDERVLKEMNEDIKKPYASSLLSLATGRHILNGSPLAFGEGNVKGRIKNVLNYRKPRFWVVVATVISVVAVSIGLVANPINTAVLSDVVGFTLKPLDRAAYGTLISENKHMDFNEAKAEEIADYLRELKVNKSAVSQSRDLDRDNTNQIHFVFRGFYNGDMGNIYFNFSKNFSEVWVNNDVKPSLSYTVKKPGEVKAFFERQFGSVTAAMEVGSAEELWKARTKYIGDNSAVGKLIGLLPVPVDVQYDHFKLHTSEQLYDIEIVYSVSSEVLKQYDTEEAVKSNPFRKNALILLALVDNANGVRTVLTDGKREVGFINARKWAEETVGRDVRDYAESPEKLQALIEMSLKTFISAKLEPTAPELSLEQSLGVSMPELDYASDDIVIFHGYFGLFVYDFNRLEIIRSIDLKPLNCHQTQGSNACDVLVSVDGNTVYLHSIESENMYVYTVSSHTLQEAPYQRMEERFSSVPTDNVIDSTKMGSYSYNAARFDTGEYGYLYTSDWTLGTLSYVRGDRIYPLFDRKE